MIDTLGLKGYITLLHDIEKWLVNEHLIEIKEHTDRYGETSREYRYPCGVITVPTNRFEKRGIIYMCNYTVEEGIPSSERKVPEWFSHLIRVAMSIWDESLQKELLRMTKIGTKEHEKYVKKAHIKKRITQLFNELD